MQHITFNGHCPECNLLDKNVKMRLNIDNDLECENCNLRVYYDGNNIAMIYRNRGKNDFAIKLTPNIFKPAYFTGADLLYDTYTNGSLLANSELISKYLSEVNTKSYINILEALIDSYIDAYYKNENQEYYNMLCNLVGIDLSQTKFNANQKTNLYLFHYLHFIMECYEAGNFSEIENFAMNSCILDLYEKHVTPYLEIMEMDIFLQKLVVKKYITTLIKTIYSPKTVK